MTTDTFSFEDVDFEKGGGLVPAIVQDSVTRDVLMLAYMDKAALTQTLRTGLVTFYSRSRRKIWVKGETSGHQLELSSVKLDCDGDTLLVDARPFGPVCHTGTATCFGDAGRSPAWLAALEAVIAKRKADRNPNSHSWHILSAGPKGAAKKFGEEASELQIAAVSESDDRVTAEAADVFYHLLLVLTSRCISLEAVISELMERNRAPES